MAWPEKKKKRTPEFVLASKRAFVSTGTQFEFDDSVIDLQVSTKRPP